MLRSLRFFFVVEAIPGWLLLLAGAGAVYAGTIAYLDRFIVDEALAVALLWQMLMASVGFTRSASAGHFDPVLVGENRTAVALAHFVHSTAIGLSLWLIVTVVEVLRYPPPHRSTEIARVAAFAFVSAATWALSLPFPRMVFGSLWLLGIVIAATTRLGVEQYAALAARDTGSLAQAAHAAALALVCPFVLIGDVMPAREASAAVLAFAAVLLLTSGSWYLARRDYPLEAA